MLVQAITMINDLSDERDLLMRQLSGEILKLYVEKKKFPEVAEELLRHRKQLPGVMRGFPDGKKKLLEVAKEFF